jgi:hypothetical protein
MKDFKFKVTFGVKLPSSRLVSGVMTGDISATVYADNADQAIAKATQILIDCTSYSTYITDVHTEVVDA